MSRSRAGMLAGLPLAGVALVAGALALAGCAAPGPAPGRSGASSGATTASTPASTAAPSVPVPVTGADPASRARASAARTTGTTGTVGTVGTAPAAPAPRSTCTSITIRVIRGSAAPGYEFAALQFVNTGTSRCVLNGYPTVSLRRSGTRVGKASSPSSSAGSSYRLAPGATAESRLKDFSTCQAPLSDEITVIAPGSKLSVSRPGQLRACTLRVYPLTAPE